MQGIVSFFKGSDRNLLFILDSLMQNGFDSFLDRILTEVNRISATGNIVAQDRKDQDRDADRYDKEINNTESDLSGITKDIGYWFSRIFQTLVLFR
jgi:hypothetical protein